MLCSQKVNDVARKGMLAAHVCRITPFQLAVLKRRINRKGAGAIDQGSRQSLNACAWELEKFHELVGDGPGRRIPSGKRRGQGRATGDGQKT